MSFVEKFDVLLNNIRVLVFIWYKIALKVRVTKIKIEKNLTYFTLMKVVMKYTFA